MSRNIDLQQRISTLSDEALMKMLQESSEYLPEAISYAQYELARRGGVYAVKARVAAASHEQESESWTPQETQCPACGALSLNTENCANCGQELEVRPASGYRYTKNPTLLTNYLKTLLWFSLIIAAVSLLFDYLELDLLYSGSITKAQADSNDARQMIISIIGLGAYLVTAIAFLQWIYRANKNCHGFGAREMNFRPGWSVGWYFVPFANFVMPYRVMKEIWQVSTNPANWQNVQGGSILSYWWALWLIGGILGNISMRLSLGANSISALQTSTTVSILSGIIDLPLYLVAISLVSAIYKKQENLLELSVAEEPSANEAIVASEKAVNIKQGMEKTLEVPAGSEGNKEVQSYLGYPLAAAGADITKSDADRMPAVPQEGGSFVEQKPDAEVPDGSEGKQTNLTDGKVEGADINTLRQQTEGTGKMFGGSQELNKYVLDTPGQGLSRKALNIYCLIGFFSFAFLLGSAFIALGKKMQGWLYIVAIYVFPFPVLFVIAEIWPISVDAVGLLWLCIAVPMYIFGWIHANVVLSRYEASALERIAQIDRVSKSLLTIDAVLEKGLLQSKVLREREVATVTHTNALQMPGGDALLLFLAGYGLFLNKRYAEAKPFFDRAMSSTNDFALIKRIKRMQTKVGKKLGLAKTIDAPVITIPQRENMAGVSQQRPAIPQEARFPSAQVLSTEVPAEPEKKEPPGKEAAISEAYEETQISPGYSSPPAGANINNSDFDTVPAISPDGGSPTGQEPGAEEPAETGEEEIKPADEQPPVDAYLTSDPIEKKEPAENVADKRQNINGPASGVKCRNCGTAVMANAAVCMSCGMQPGNGRNFCPNCGAATDPNAIICVKCGVSLPAAAPASGAVVRKEGASSLSIVSMVLSLVGIFSCVTAVPGFIIGMVELKKIKRGESSEAGRGFALTGAIVGGILSGLLALVLLVYLVLIIVAIAMS
ncbi:MAG: DUF4328 domain-containing protein [Thermoleophilia bacterium]|jgi:hypothetical protein